MNREDIEQWTRKAGGFDATPEFLAKFAAIVASAEREACAKMCEKFAVDMTVLAEWGASQCANAIRARNNQ